MQRYKEKMIYVRKIEFLVKKVEKSIFFTNNVRTRLRIWNFICNFAGLL